MFICPKCRAGLKGFIIPDRCECGYLVPQVDSVFQFCDDPPMSLEHDGGRYLGYDGVGENYEGPHSPDPSGEYGIFGGCSMKLVDLLGRGSVILDLGAGLGPASITLARAGANTIGVDISQKMLSVAASTCSLKYVDVQELGAGGRGARRMER